MLRRVLMALGLALLLTGCGAAEPEPIATAIPVPLPVSLPVEEVEEAAEPTVKQGVFDIVGYCACCTPYADMNRDEQGRVLTASGEWVEIGQCVAVDPEIIPLGSTVTINGKSYTALDTGVKGYVIDILMEHDEAHTFGCRTMTLVTWTE